MQYSTVKMKKRTREPVLPQAKLRAFNPIKLYKETKANLRNDPDNLIGREQERRSVLQFWLEHIEEQKSGSMYISGAPGCGKTALLRELHAHFENYEEENVGLTNFINFDDYIKIFVRIFPGQMYYI